MKPLAAQHSSVPLVSGEGESCAGAAACRELQSCLQGMAHVPRAQSHRRLHEGRGKSRVFLPLSLALSAIWCEDPSQRHLGAYSTYSSISENNCKYTWGQRSSIFRCCPNHSNPDATVCPQVCTPTTLAEVLTGEGPGITGKLLFTNAEAIN